MIAAYKGMSSGSRVIKVFNWGDYSHVSWVDPEDREIEAWLKGGVRMVQPPHTDHTPGTPVELYDVDLTQGELDGLREFLRAQLGKKYDLVGCLHFATRRPEYAFQQDRWFCSELIHAGFRVIRRDLLMRVESYKVSPSMIVYSPRLKFVEAKTVPEKTAAFAPGRVGGYQDTPPGGQSRMQSAKDQLQSSG